MSVIALETIRQFVRATHHGDDELLQRLLDGAEDEALMFLDRAELPRARETCPDCTSEGTANPVSDGNAVAPSVETAVCLLVQADYDQSGADAAATKDLAWRKLRPYRCKIGV